MGVGSPGSGLAVSEMVFADAGCGEPGGGLLKLAGGGALGVELGGALNGTCAGLLIGAAAVGGCELGGAAATGGCDATGGWDVGGAAVGGAEMFPVPLSRFTLVGNGEMAGRNGCDSLRGGGAWARTADENRVARAAAQNADRDFLREWGIRWVLIEGLPSGITGGRGEPLKEFLGTRRCPTLPLLAVWGGSIEIAGGEGKIELNREFGGFSL